MGCCLCSRRLPARHRPPGYHATVLAILRVIPHLLGDPEQVSALLHPGPDVGRRTPAEAPGTVIIEKGRRFAGHGIGVAVHGVYDLDRFFGKLLGHLGRRAETA